MVWLPRLGHFCPHLFGHFLWGKLAAVLVVLLPWGHHAVRKPNLTHREHSHESPRVYTEKKTPDPPPWVAPVLHRFSSSHYLTATPKPKLPTQIPQPTETLKDINDENNCCCFKPLGLGICYTACRGNWKMKGLWRKEPKGKERCRDVTVRSKAKRWQKSKERECGEGIFRKDSGGFSSNKGSAVKWKHLGWKTNDPTPLQSCCPLALWANAFLSWRTLCEPAGAWKNSSPWKCGAKEQELPPTHTHTHASILGPPGTVWLWGVVLI